MFDEDVTQNDPVAIEDDEGCFNDLCACGHGLDDHVGVSLNGKVPACFLCACDGFVE